MPLMDHLREFRTRLIRAVIALAVGVVVAWIYYKPILRFLIHPYEAAKPQLHAQGVTSQFTFVGIAGGFQFQLQLSLIVGAIISSPFWLWQLWAFVLPALHRHEKRAVLGLSATTVPLFAGGVALCYAILPKTMVILGSFVPESGTNLLTATSYLQFVTRMMLLFGLAAQMPVIVVILNRIGAVSAKQLARARPWIVVGIFVFAAVATPTPDPITMNFVAVPMTIMYLVAEQIARLTDRRRAGVTASIEDDDVSPLDGPEPV